MSNVNPQFSQVYQKKQAFHKQIRSRIRQQYFATQRKLLFQAQWLTTVSENKQDQGQNRLVISSLQQLQAHLNDTFVPDYAAIVDYLECHNSQPLPQQFFSTLISHSTQPSFMKNEHALILLVKLFNTKEFNKDHWLTQQRVKYYVHKVVEENMILYDPHHRIYRLDYFTTVCWFLYVVSILAKDKGLMMELKGHLQMMQDQAYHQLPAEFIFLLSELSTCSDLLPSQQFIQRLLTHEQLQTEPLEYSIHLVNLLDNYLRYRCQQLYRFDDQESQQLTVEYFRFITKKIKNLKFPSKLKIDLINLVITIVRCAEEELIVQLFNKQESNQLCLQLLYRSQFAQWQAKSVSFQCLFEILSRKELLPKVIEYIDPARISNLLVNSMTLPDRMFQMTALSSIMSLLINQHDVFKKYFKNSNFKNNIMYLEISDKKYYQSQECKVSLVEYALGIQRQFLFDQQK